MDDTDNVPGGGRVVAAGSVAMAVGFVVLAVKLAPKPEAVVCAVFGVVFTLLTLFIWRNPPTWG